MLKWQVLQAMIFIGIMTIMSLYSSRRSLYTVQTTNNRLTSEVHPTVDTLSVSSTATTKNTKRQNSKARFVFVIGLEGTGHHLAKTIWTDSPNTKLLKELNIYPLETTKLVTQLFQQDDGGLFNAHCAINLNTPRLKKMKNKVSRQAKKKNKKGTTKVGRNQNKRRKKTTTTVNAVDGPRRRLSSIAMDDIATRSSDLNSIAVSGRDEKFNTQNYVKGKIRGATGNNSNNNIPGKNDTMQSEGLILEDDDINKLRQRVVDTLRTIENKAAKYSIDGETARENNNNNSKNNNKQPVSQLTVPINVLSSVKRSGMMSYPNYSGECRKLNFPNIDLLYQACDQANVDCDHIYLYRDPYAVITSTSIKRRFNKSILSGIHLYTMVLKTILADLHAYPTRNAGCIGFYETDQATMNQWKTLVRDMFGWTNQKLEFEKYIEKIYVPPTALTQEERESLIPSKYEAYMKSMIGIHDEVTTLCNEQYHHQQQQQQQQSNFDSMNL